MRSGFASRYGDGVSIPVAIDDVRAETERYGFAYLLTVRESQRPHIVAVTPEWVGQSMVMSVGRGTAANAAARPEITLCYPPVEDGGYSLIIDGRGSVDRDEVLTFAPEGAVLHRPATPGSESATGCENDCKPIGS